MPVLLESLCANDPLHALEAKQALAKQFAELIEFVMAFDELKMKNPAIQNDFGYYRRAISRMKMNDIVSENCSPDRTVSINLSER